VDTINDGLNSGGKFKFPIAGDGGNDTLKIENGTTLSDLDFERSGTDWILAIRSTMDQGKEITTLNDQLIIQNYTNVDRTVENISFSDGTTVQLKEWQIGTSGKDILSGNSRMYGGRGDDTYVVDSVNDIIVENINAGTDTVQSNISYTLGTNVENLTLTGSSAISATGNALNNSLIGNSAANQLTGGKGRDILYGGVGNDTYFFNLGDGIDKIYDYDMGANTTSGGNDTVKFGTGITKSSVALFKSGSDFILSYGAGDQITLANQSISNNVIEKVTLSDGNYLTSFDMDRIIQSMNAYAISHEIAISSIDTVKANQDLMNIVAGGWHNQAVI
jgi:Ca2+-binding RTX toxin-like protein